MIKKIKVVVITGPTATGKTALAVRLARRFDGEIISADSRQVFRGLDLGSGKDLAEYSAGGAPVPFHLIDIVEPMEDYHLMGFCRDAATALKTIAADGRLPIFCGGTALYLDAILRGYTLPGSGPDSEARERLKDKTVEELLQLLKEKDPARYFALTEKENPTRIIRALEMCDTPMPQVEPVADLIDPLVIAPYIPRNEVHRRIAARLDQRLDAGMIDEVAHLHASGVSWERLEFFGLEYRFVAQFLQNKISRAEMRELLFYRIRQFAKRQDIWFRKMEREGLNIYWLDATSLGQAEELIRLHLADQVLPPPVIRIKDIHYGPITSVAKDHTLEDD